MANSILKLKVESSEYDAKLKKAAEGIRHLAEVAHRSGGELTGLEKAELDYVRGLGSMETKSRTAAGSVRELESTFKELKVVYTQLNDQEKKGDFGRALNASLEQLKQRAIESRKELNDVAKELGGTQSKGIDLSGAIQTLGSKFGISSEALSMLSTGTVAYTAVLGGLTTAVIAGTKAWADYNAELAKQDQITTVTTGLKGDDANRMTDKARALSDTYGVDFRETINAANTLMTQFGKTGDEAIRLLRNGMQGMIQGDGPKLLSMIQQYAPSFRDAGIEASQLVAIIQNSEGGIFTDQNMNAIVMGIKNIRLMTKATSDALAQLGIDGNKMSQQLSDGSLTIFDALKQVATAIQGVDSGSKAAGEVMQQVFGRQGAMAGTKLGEAIATLNINLDETKRQTGEVGQSYDDLYEANVKLNQAIRDCFGYDGWEQMSNGIKAKLVTALADVLDITVKIKESWVGDVGSTIFDTMTDAALKASGPLGTVLSLLRNINSESGKGGNSGGYSDIEKIQKWINNGKDDNERRSRYDKAIADLQKKLNNVGKERAVRNSDGSTSYVIDDEETQAQKRAAIQKRMKMLYATSYTEETPIKPTKPIPTHTTTGGKTPQQQAEDKVAEALLDYQQTIDKANLGMKEGYTSELDVKRKQLSAQERLYDAYGDAYNMYHDPKYKEAQDKAAEEIVRLKGEVAASAEAQKKAQEAAKDLETAQKNLAKAQQDLADAQASGDLKRIYAAEKKVETAQQAVTQSSTITVKVEGKEALEQLQKLEGIQTVKVNVEEGDVNLPQVPTDDQTIKVNVEQGKIDLPEVPTDDKTIRVNVEQGNVNLPQVPTDDQTIKVNVEQGNVNLPEVPTDDQTIKVNVVVDDAKAIQSIQQLEGVTIDVPVNYKPQDGNLQPVEIPLTTANLDAFTSHIKEELANADLGSSVALSLQEGLSDATAIGTILQTAIQNGIDTAQFDTSGLMQKLMNHEDISDEDIQAYVDQLNEKLKEKFAETEWPNVLITFDADTKNIVNAAKQQEKDAQNMVKNWQSAGSAIQAVGQAMSQIEDPAAKVMATIAQAIATIALSYAQASLMAAKNPLNAGWGWIAFAAAGVATMISSIAAIHSATGYANGGIYDGPSGFVPGNKYSGDNVMANGGTVGLNSGELILNRAQQGIIADALEGNTLGNLQLETRVDAEELIFILNNNARRRGYGRFIND